MSSERRRGDAYGVGSQTVLLADDEQRVLELIAEIFPTLGCELLPARDGPEAIELFQAERPPLVLTDRKMPRIDGLPLMTAATGASSRTEILISPAQADVESAIQAVRQGAFDYLPKPFDVEPRRRSVNRALGRHQRVSEKEAWLAALEQRVQARTAALGDSQRRLRAVFSAIRDALLIVDPTFTIRAANEGAAALSGTPLKDLVGRKCTGRSSGVRRSAKGARSARPLPPVGPPLSRRNPDGRDGYLDVYGYPVADEGGRPRAAVEHIRDVTERIYQARHLQNAEQLAAVGQFAAGLAHELGNALALIGGSVQLLLGDPGDRRETTRKYLEMIPRSVAAAARTIRQWLAFARPREPFLRVLDVTESLDRACRLLGGEFEKHGVHVVRESAPDRPLIQGDSAQLQQVFLHLLLNAVQALDEGGTITIRALFDPPEGVRGEVTDTGRGIPPEHLDRIFDPFFTTREGGTGLGLSIAHRYVGAHGGRLTVESQEGRGTRFTILLPAMTPERIQGGLA